ncbi:MAG: hypothetical protein LBL48_06820 [Azoarcus sp.]|jgi:hypothetical protein|nr:hypothetical protein [Azoarcus sp.]
MIAATIHARRITGAAIVTVRHADGRERQYRVTLRRYGRLRDTLNAHLDAVGGYISKHGFEASFYEVGGFAAARRWLLNRFRRGARWPRHWRPA